MSEKYHIPLLTLLAGVLFFVNLGGYDLWAPDEPRFAEVAREMMTSGDYLAPHVNGVPYTEKPPLFFWAEALLAMPFGDVTEWPARMPSALAGVVTVILTYLLARRLHGPRTAFAASLILMTMQRFWWQSRFAQIDMLLTACLTGALLCFWCWHKERRKGYLAGFYLCIAAGVLAKGPPAILFPALLALAFYWKQPDQRKRLRPVLGLLAVAVIVAAWLVPARMAIAPEAATDAGAGVAANLYRQTIGRFFLGVAHANAPWFYLEKLPGDLLPWALFLPWTLPWVWRRRREGPEMRFLLSWILPALLFFSACLGKRAIYLLPLYPAFAIILARSIEDLVSGEYVRWRTAIALVWGGAVLIVAAAPLVVDLSKYDVDPGPGLLVLSACAIVCGLYTLWSAWRTGGRHIPRQMAAQFVLFATLSVFVVLPVVNEHKSARTFCEPLETLASSGERYDLFSLGFSREEYIYYSDHFHEPVLCSLLDVPGMQDMSLLEQGRRQLAMQRAVRKAVENTPIEAIDSVTEAERSALQAAMDRKLRAPDGQQSYEEAYNVAVREELSNLFSRMAESSPSFLLVQEEDWRWVLAFAPEARKLHLLRRGNVGSREVLLLGNDGATKLAMRQADGIVAEATGRV